MEKILQARKTLVLDETTSKNDYTYWRGRKISNPRIILDKLPYQPPVASQHSNHKISCNVRSNVIEKSRSFLPTQRKFNEKSNEEANFYDDNDLFNNIIANQLDK